MKKGGKGHLFHVNIGNKTIDFSLHTGYDKYDHVFLHVGAFSATTRAENIKFSAAIKAYLRLRLKSPIEKSVHQHDFSIFFIQEEAFLYENGGQAVYYRFTIWD